ncbi:uncharacterized protein LOC116767238 isoform X2 [Danaus plexippus]|uniref:uncharacterized protein LOC116767238 isoform X2 n=1 Tax=Danaus plexippus TaxID=13037 RepID=UPI0013C3F1A9|nr:uncharacterized protein LOC116767238 isoform X2 [Danaus plexippus]
MDTARSDSELPNKMALLDIMEVGESSVESVVSNPPSRVLRKRKCLAPEPSKSSNRRRLYMKSLNQIVLNVITSLEEEKLRDY